MLQIYNSLTKQKETFKPITPGKVQMYVCGMTVYDYCHLGHARSMLVFDVVSRYLRFSGYDLTYIRNITDVDDKIIQRANENKENCDALTERFIDALHEDERALGILSPDQEPRATRYIADIVAMIEQLVEKSFAYVATNGDVYYHTRKFAEYGKLSKRDLDQLRAGERIEVVSEKQDPLDFVLWKLAKPDEPYWPSPWGNGRPGWHSECSVMSSKCLSDHIDIHGGGMDLMFPHHENEIAQAEAITGKRFVNTWMHNGFLNINEEKMSKSLKNFLTIRDALQDHDAESIRYLYVASHYRKPLNYSDESLYQARNALERLYNALRGLPEGVMPQESAYEQRFRAVMDDDFNTPEALAVLFDLAKEINIMRDKDLSKAADLAALLKYLGQPLGLLSQDPERFLKGDADNSDEIDALILKRNQARADKDWAMADQVRDQLHKMGIEIEDGANGTTWRRK